MPVKAGIAFLISFSLASFLTRVRLHWRYGWDWAYLHRVIFCIFMGFITVPLRMVERLLHSRAIARERLRSPPVFIVGHWRSGTTHLHALMAADDQFGFVPSYQVPRSLKSF